MNTYEIWILGFELNGDVNDYEKLVATFEDEDVAIWFMNHYDFTKPDKTPLARAVLECVVDNSCVSVVMETEI